MSVEPGPYVPWPPPTVNYPEPPVRRDPHPFAIALAIFAAVLFLVSVVFLIFGAMRRSPAPVTMPAPVTTTMTTTVTEAPIAPAPVGNDGWLSGLHLMGYPVPDEVGAIQIGHDICANLRAENGAVPKALAYLNGLTNAPEGFNQGDAVALVWAAEDAYCPEQPRQ